MWRCRPWPKPGAIQFWPIKLKAEQGERAITGLYRVDEVALNALADDVFRTCVRHRRCQSPTRKCYRWAN